ncbi:hypothetical protein VTL71DRAFT_10404 [Oculimacula yallundae]|uniref:Uncharacterized protein n=1 Tax=Oculimacula yallundae TaxID=86028 RepID=A0ABR4CT00_9HELO
MSSSLPLCLGIDYTGHFFAPNFGTTAYSLSVTTKSLVEISWFAGKNVSGSVQKASLFLEKRGKRAALVDSGSFLWTGYKALPASNWSSVDQCGNTKLSYNWTVPSISQLVTMLNLAGTTDHSSQFNFVVETSKSTFPSPGFIITDQKSSMSGSATQSLSTSVSTTTATSNSLSPVTVTIIGIASTSLSPAPQKDSASPSMSGATKAGIGVGSAIAGLLLFLLGFMIYIRRRRSTKAPELSRENTNFPIAELGEDTTSKRRVESGGVEINEIGSVIRKQSPVELMAT